MTAVDEVFFLVLQLLDNGFSLVTPVVLTTFSLVFGWAVTRLAFAWLAGAMDNVFGDLIGLFVVFWIFLAIAWSAKEIVDAAGNFALALGAGIMDAGSTVGSTADLFAPSSLWGIGEDQAKKILETKKSMCSGTWECIKTMDDRIMVELAALFIYVAFGFLVFEMATTAIGYKVNGIFMLLFTPMAVVPFTKALSEGAIQGWLNHLVKLTIIAMVAGLGSRAFGLMDLPATPVFDDIIPCVLLAVFISWLAWQSRTLAAGIISAVPQLSSQSITTGVSNVMRTATGTGRLAQAATSVGNHEKATIGAAVRSISAGMGRAPGRIAEAGRAIRSGDVASKAYWSRVSAASAQARTPAPSPVSSRNP